MTRRQERKIMIMAAVLVLGFIEGDGQDWTRGNSGFRGRADTVWLFFDLGFVGGLVKFENVWID
jgi:hypothetical protein